MSKSIGILGCGWLGSALAGLLINEGNDVRGTVRRKEQLESLTALGIHSFLIDLTPQKLYGDVERFLKGLDVLVISLPPGTRKDPDYDFAESIRLFLTFTKVYGIQQVIFISSTGVFQDFKNFPKYDENDIPNGFSNSAKQLITAENHIQQYHGSTTVIRPGGLIGKNRHPITFLASRKMVSHPSAPINLVDQDYLVQRIVEIINHKDPPSVIHAISLPHHSRKDYYVKQALERELEPPEFNEHDASLGKKIVSLY